MAEPPYEQMTPLQKLRLRRRILDDALAVICSNYSWKPPAIFDPAFSVRTEVPNYVDRPTTPDQ